MRRISDIPEMSGIVSHVFSLFFVSRKAQPLQPFRSRTEDKYPHSAKNLLTTV